LVAEVLVISHVPRESCWDSETSGVLRVSCSSANPRCPGGFVVGQILDWTGCGLCCS